MNVSPRHFGSFAVLLVVVLFAGPVWAGHGEQELTFREIEVSVTENDQLRINYTIADADWERLQHEGVHPELNIYTEHEDGGGLKYAYNFDVASQHGSLTVPDEIDAFDLAQFQIEVLGFADAWRIARLGARGVSGARLAFVRGGDSFSLRAVGAESCRLAAGDVEGIGGADDSEESNESDESDGSDHAHESDESDEADESDDSETSEGSDGSPPKNWKAKVIEACNGATEYDSDMKSCTKLAMDIAPTWAADTVESCAEVFDYNSEFETCLEKAEQYETHDPSGVIEACDGVSDYSSTVQSCIDSAAAYTANPVPVINACTQATDYDSDRATCINLGQKLGEGGAAIIRACSGRSVEDCINNASR